MKKMVFGLLVLVLFLSACAPGNISGDAKKILSEKRVQSNQIPCLKDKPLPKPYCTKDFTGSWKYFSNSYYKSSFSDKAKSCELGMDITKCTSECCSGLCDSLPITGSAIGTANTFTCENSKLKIVK